MKKKTKNNLIIKIIFYMCCAILGAVIGYSMKKPKKVEVVIAESPILSPQVESELMELKPMWSEYKPNIPVVDAPIVSPTAPYTYEELIITPTAPNLNISTNVIRKENPANEVITFCGVLETEYGIIISDDDKISLIDGNMTYQELLDKVVK